MFEHGVSEAPAIVQFQYWLQGVGQGRRVIISDDVCFRAEDGAVALGLFGGGGLDLGSKFIEDLLLFTFILF